MTDLVDKIEFGRKLEVNLAENPTEPLKTAVVEFLAERDVVVEFPKDWLWDWTLGPNPSGYSGNLPKRISKLRYQQHGKRIEVKVQSDLGEMFQRLLPKEQLMTVDFTRDLTWEAGEFGDKSSCFACDKEHLAFNEFSNWGGFAMRQWEGAKGVGRVLVAPYEGLLAVFNAYYPGKDGYGHGDSVTYARAVAHVLGTDCLRTDRISSGKSACSYSASGRFYTTSHGYLIGPLDTIRPMVAAGVYLGVK